MAAVLPLCFLVVALKMRGHLLKLAFIRNQSYVGTTSSNRKAFSGDVVNDCKISPNGPKTRFRHALSNNEHLLNQ